MKKKAAKRVKVRAPGKSPVARTTTKPARIKAKSKSGAKKTQISCGDDNKKRTEKSKARAGKAERLPALEKLAVVPAATNEGIRSLPPRQRDFVDAYLANKLNATKAAIAAGYSAKTAESQGSRLLRNVKVAAAIAQRTAVKMEELDFSIDRTLREVARLAFFDIIDIFNDDGSLKALKDMSPVARAAIAGLQIEEEFFPGLGGDGEDADPIVEPERVLTKKIKLTDRRAALDMLMRYHSLYHDKVEHTGKVTLETLVLGADEVVPA